MIRHDETKCGAFGVWTGAESASDSRNSCGKATSAPDGYAASTLLRPGRGSAKEYWGWPECHANPSAPVYTLFVLALKAENDLLGLVHR
jgi:hypothetical protein